MYSVDDTSSTGIVPFQSTQRHFSAADEGVVVQARSENESHRLPSFCEPPEYIFCNDNRYRNSEDHHQFYSPLGSDIPNPGNPYRGGVFPLQFYPNVCVEPVRQQLFFNQGVMRYYPNHAPPPVYATSLQTLYTPFHTITPRQTSFSPSFSNDENPHAQHNRHQFTEHFTRLPAMASIQSQANTEISTSPCMEILDVQQKAHRNAFPPNLQTALVSATSSFTFSPLLKEFRTNKARKWQVDHIRGHVAEFSRDQHGSRFIQKQLETINIDDMQMVFDEIVPTKVISLSEGVYGNYVIQKLFEHGNQIQRNEIITAVQGHALALSLQMEGISHRSDQAIEFMSPAQQSLFIEEIEPHVLACAKDSNGNHVIQKLVEWVSPDRLSLVKRFCGSVHNLSTHPYGCRVLQKLLEHLPETYCRPLLNELHKFSGALMRDQFGNYVIQYLLEHGETKDKNMIYSKLREQFLQMARHKFASNVCEKALTCADAENRRALIEEIITVRHHGSNMIVVMMRDPFANYVLQQALSVVEGEQKEMLYEKVRSQLCAFRKYPGTLGGRITSIERQLEGSSRG